MTQELATKTRQKIERDSKIPGLHIIHGKNRSTWYLYYRTKARVERRQRLGDLTVMNVTRAREKARSILAVIDLGGDPILDQVNVQIARSYTFQMLRVEYDRIHSTVENKASTHENKKYCWTLILKHYGPGKSIADIKRPDIIAFKSANKDRPYQANRCLALLSHAFNQAEDWGWIPERSSPVYRVKHYKETKRQRVPSIDEVRSLFAAIDRMRQVNPWFAGMVALLCFMGARRGEIMTSKREWWQPHGLVLPDSKTGAKIIPVNSAAWGVVALIPSVEANPYLIVGKLPGTHLCSPKSLWARLIKDAGIEDLRMHDLRRWFASVSISSGQTLEQTMQLMGHASSQTTRGYAFLMDHAKTSAMQNTGNTMLSMIEKKPNTNAGQR